MGRILSANRLVSQQEQDVPTPDTDFVAKDTDISSNGTDIIRKQADFSEGDILPDITVKSNINPKCGHEPTHP